jgi:hypothetical protein
MVLVVNYLTIYKKNIVASSRLISGGPVTLTSFLYPLLSTEMVLSTLVRVKVDSSIGLRSTLA